MNLAEADHPSLEFWHVLDRKDRSWHTSCWHPSGRFVSSRNTIANFWWWNDWNGNAKHFCAGDWHSHSDVSVRDCELDGNTTMPTPVQLTCNQPMMVYLNWRLHMANQLLYLKICFRCYFHPGVISEKEVLLAVSTRLNYGRTQLESSFRIHTPNRFECSGQVISGIPNSCEDLWRIGHTLSGLFSAKGIKMVYCDFTKLRNAADASSWFKCL